MVKSYLFPLTKEESETISDFGWNFIKDNKDRLVEIDLDMSSIDFGFGEASRFVVNGISYAVHNTYCECVGMNTNRILLAQPILLEKDNPSLLENTEEEDTA